MSFTLRLVIPALLMLISRGCKRVLFSENVRLIPGDEFPSLIVQS